MTDTTTSLPARRGRRMAREVGPATMPGAETAAAPAASGAEAKKAGTTDAGGEPRTTKAGHVIALLQRGEGASVEDVVALTGWLPHTARAALTGLRKKGHRVTSEKTEGNARVYRIVVDQTSTVAPA